MSPRITDSTSGSMHWTYEESARDSDLEQGDLILPSDQLSSLLGVVHPWFDKKKYIGFIVVTQTCDLHVRSEHGCNARHISLAPIRSLDSVLATLFDETCEGIGRQVYFRSSKQDARRLVRRIINQNETALGLFYLHADGNAGMAVPAVATLRIKLSLRRSAYGTLKDARVGRLKPEFQARLGCMVGELYSRVAVEDWTTDDTRRAKQNDIVDGFIDGPGLRVTPIWVDSKTAKAAGNAIDLGTIPRANLEDQLAKFRRNPEDVVIESLTAALEHSTELDGEEINRVVKNLMKWQKNRIRQAIKLAVDQAQND